jgi:hypothetical protein
MPGGYLNSDVKQRLINPCIYWSKVHFYCIYLYARRSKSSRIWSHLGQYMQGHFFFFKWLLHFVVGSVVTAVVPFVHDYESSVLAKCIEITIGLCIHHIKGYWKWFSSANRYASHLTNTLFITHQRFCGETENTKFWMLSFSKSEIQWLLLCSLTFKMSYKIIPSQIWWVRRLHSLAYYYRQKQCKHFREQFVMQHALLATRNVLLQLDTCSNDGVKTFVT